MSDLKIVNIIPLGNGGFKDTLTYYTNKAIKPGSIVFVPLRKKMIAGILISEEKVENIKSEIKSLNFEIKKINSYSENKFLSDEFLKATEITSDHFLANKGQVVSCFIPSSIIKACERGLDIGDEQKNKKEQNTITEKKEEDRGVYLVQSPTEDRLAFYKSLIREEFAKNSSIFMFFPTQHELRYFYEILKKGIEKYAIMLKPEDTPKKTAINWKKISEDAHPLLIMATPLFSSLISKRNGVVIIEKESSPAYKNFIKPHIDTRFFLEILAKEYKRKIIYGDTIIRSETLYKIEKEEAEAMSVFKWRFVGGAKNNILDMKESAKTKDEIISEDIIDLIEKSIKDGEKSLFLTTRRGLSSAIICGDCGWFAPCEKCGGTMSLHRKQEVNEFKCHKCLNIRSSEINCEKCGSWNIRTIGFGTEKIEEMLMSKFPNERILRIDSDVVKNQKQGKKISDEFYSESGKILVGTEMAMYYMNEKIDNIFILSADTLFSIPDFKMNERIFNYLTNAKMLAKKNFVIQTRMKENPIFEKIIRGDLLQFYRQEILDRRNFDYPPFKRIIKISLEGKRGAVEKEMEMAISLLNKWQMDKFRMPIPGDNEKIKTIILLRVDPNNWPNKNNICSQLFKALVALPPHFSIKVDPENLT